MRTHILASTLSHSKGELLAMGRELVLKYAERAHVPYSTRKEAALLILSDGSWIPGVRVESASFSLTIPPLLNAATTAVAGGRSDISGVVLSRPMRPEERVLLQMPPFDQLTQVGEDCAGPADDTFPEPLAEWDPLLKDGVPANPVEGIRLARSVARRAHVPESDFSVGCVIVTGEGHAVPGVNVEHSDWSRVLCAERNAIGTVVSYDLGRIETLYLSCLRDSSGTPCGACRQLMAELAPRSTLWMDRGERPPASSDPSTLLPGSFRGTSIQKKP